MAKMTDAELLAYLGSEKKQSLGMFGGDLSAQRPRAMDYYLGEMDDLPALDGSSSAVSTDVQDAVEGLMPDLMEIFAGTDEVARFEPIGPEDEELAAQETEYVNHVFYQKNPGFVNIYHFVKDALLQKVGVVKHWWEEEEHTERRQLFDQPDDSFALLLAELEAQEDVEVVEHTERQEVVVGQDGVGQSTILHDITWKRAYTRGRLRVEPVPPEEFLIASDARSVRDARYVAHRKQTTQSDLIAQGYDPEIVKKIPTFSRVDGEVEVARRTVDDESTVTDVLHDPARPVEVVEHWVKVDYDGDDIAEWRAVVSDAQCSVILSNESSDSGPHEIFSAMTPIITCHRFMGRSIADLVMDIQRIKTALVRQTLDNLYRITNPITEIADAGVGDHTYDDLLTRRPGGIVRTSQPGHLILHAPQPVINQTLPALEYWDAAKENRTGVTRYNQGIDADSLNKTAHGVERIMGAAERRMKLIARVFAETGIKDMMLAVHALTIKHQDWAEKVRIRGQWVTVDPRNWKERDDMTINVGLGTGSRDQQLVHLNSILGMQIKAVEFQGGVDGPLVTLSNIHNSVKKIVENAGLKSPELYFTEPDPNAPPQPPRQDPKVVEAQAKMQLEAQKAQMGMQIEQAKLQQDAQRQDAELALEREKFQQELALRREQITAELNLKREQLAAELALKRENNAMNAAVKGAATSGVSVGGEPG